MTVPPGRLLALDEVAWAAASGVQAMERVKVHLNDLTPEQAQLWFLARQALDRLYAAVK